MNNGECMLKLYIYVAEEISEGKDTGWTMSSYSWDYK